MVLAINLGFIVIQSLASDPIITDRPDFTESSFVVPDRRWQVESGATYERTGRRNLSLGLPEVLLRKGMGTDWELRLGLPSYYRIESNGNQIEGFGDVYLGAKVALGQVLPGIAMALIPAVSLPVGRPGVRSESATPEVKWTYAAELRHDYALSGMLYGSLSSDDGEYEILWQATTSLGIPICNRFAAFVEHVMDFARRSRPAHTLHAGFVHQPSADRQWDLHFGTGITPAAPDVFVGVGFSVRF